MNYGEMKDNETRALVDELTELHHEFHEAMDKLNGMADDFSEGSQQRWMIALREANELRDQIWLRQNNE